MEFNVSKTIFHKRYKAHMLSLWNAFRRFQNHLNFFSNGMIYFLYYKSIK